MRISHHRPARIFLCATLSALMTIPSWGAAIRCQSQEEVDRADPDELFALYGPDPDYMRVEIVGYAIIDKTLPLEERIQCLADESFGEGRLKVTSMMEAEGRRIAVLEMAEKDAYENPSSAYWYQAFQGSTGSLLMSEKLSQTFGQETFEGDWPDEFHFYPHVWLGSHAQDTGWSVEPGEHGTIRRRSWRIEGAVPDKRDLLPSRLPTKIVPLDARGSDDFVFAGFQNGDIEFGKETNWGYRLEYWKAEGNDESLTWASRCTNVRRPETLTFSRVDGWLLKDSPPAALQSDPASGTLKLAVFESNCRQPDLWPPHRRERILRTPPDLHFQFVHRRPLALRLDETAINPDANPEKRAPVLLSAPESLHIGDRRFDQLSPIQLDFGQNMTLVWRLVWPRSAHDPDVAWQAQGDVDFLTARPDIAALQKLGFDPAKDTLQLEIIESKAFEWETLDTPRDNDCYKVLLRLPIEIQE